MAKDDTTTPEPLKVRRAQAKAERRQALIESLGQGDDDPPRDPRQIPLGLEASSDGLWLNHLQYHGDFKRPACRERAIEHLAALFPQHFNGLQTVASPIPTKPSLQGN